MDHRETKIIYMGWNKYLKYQHLLTIGGKNNESIFVSSDENLDLYLYKYNTQQNKISQLIQDDDLLDG